MGSKGDKGLYNEEIWENLVITDPFTSEESRSLPRHHPRWFLGFMIIAIDAGVLGVTDERLKVGVYKFAVNLLEYLSKIDKKNNYRLYSFDPIPKKLLDKFDTNWTNLVIRPKKGWLTFRLSIEFLLHKPDIFLGLSQALPFYCPAKSIVYIHDLAFEYYPQFYKDSYKRLRRQTKFAVENCHKVVAVSKTTKEDLTKLYKVKPEKIEVVYHGVNDLTLPSPKRRGFKDEASGFYFLFVGSYKPGKNITNIIKAFKLFQKKTKKPYQLVLAGSDYWGDGILKQVQDDKIKILGYVKDDELVRLYKDATAFVSPAYYEGFGMPIVEAMSYGVPVIASNKGSIPEVTRDAAILIDPDDAEGIATAMGKVITDENFRLQMIKKGLKQAKKFSWEKSAGELLKLINF